MGCLSLCFSIEMPVIHKRTDIFRAPTYIPLVHCTSLCFSMSRGLARDVKQRYGGKEKVMPFPRPVVGGLGIIISPDGKMVINLVTKKFKSQKPQWKHLVACLQALFHFCIHQEIKEISMPYRMSCGLDKLDWPRVLHLIRILFDDSPVTVYICQKLP